jgi:uncharacterized protein YdeI (YjbR/CyaY-like superfamily)
MRMAESNPEPCRKWEGFSRSAKRGILERILYVKRPETRQKRIEETVEFALKKQQ